ncbi:hypothetical protein B0H19DRAFT_1190627 [Mycena capillaripes]|nr:hypothetical protein B0H19DRAFT_1190627 [Mycena capillaripes]
MFLHRVLSPPFLRSTAGSHFHLLAEGSLFHPLAAGFHSRPLAAGSRFHPLGAGSRFHLLTSDSDGTALAKAVDEREKSATISATVAAEKRIGGRVCRLGVWCLRESRKRRLYIGGSSTS